VVISVIALSLFFPSHEHQSGLINIIIGFISFFVSMILGYYVHVFSHALNLQQPLDDLAYRKGMPWFLTKIIEGISYLFHFHDQVHHNSNVNRIWYNVVIEFLQNLYSEGIGLIIFLQVMKKCVFNPPLNQYICFAWAWIYSTVHIINYSIWPSTFHIQHHLDKYTNYGFDLADTMFGSKYDMEPERINHASINVLVMMVLLLMAK
jgi:hypothetical protein